MIEVFNKLMQGFITEPISFDYLEYNPEGTLRSGSSCCHYKLKGTGENQVLGAYGVSRFTNPVFYEIGLNGDIQYEWFCQESYVPGNEDSKQKMIDHHSKGMKKISKFGIKY